MQKIHVLIIFGFAFLLTSCSTSKGTVVTKAKSFQKIFLVSTTADIQARVRLENEMNLAAAKDGYSTVKSLDVIPFSLNEPKIPAKEEIDSKAKENRCDAVFILSVLRKEEAVAFNKGTNTKANPQFLAGVLGMVLGKKGDFRTQGDIKDIPAVSIPGQYAHEKGYFIIQSFLYDVATTDIMFSGQSENFDISSLDKISKSYPATLIVQLEKEKLLKK